MQKKSDQIKTQPRFDVVIFYFIDRHGWFRKVRYAYSLPDDPHAGDAFLDDCRTLGGAVWAIGRAAHVFMPTSEAL